MISVVGARGDREVTRFVLGHGEDPLRGLAARGWAAGAVKALGGLGDLVLRYEVEPVAADPGRSGPEQPAAALSAAERARVRLRQRVAAYAVVVADGAVLLTQLASTTGAGGRWNLPGGGLDPGEAPGAAVVREVAEETGQAVDRVRLLEVRTQHWVGRSSRGVEDRHAVRLIHLARCTRPTRPVVHDVGGSTSDARWVPVGELGSVPVVPTVPVALEAAGVGWPHPRPQS